MVLICNECGRTVNRGISSKNICIKCDNKTKQKECSKCKKKIMDYVYTRYDTLCSNCYKKLNQNLVSSANNYNSHRTDYSMYDIMLYLFRLQNKDNNAKPNNDIKYIRTKQDICNICLDNFKDDDDITIMSDCNHYIHSTCYNLWKNNNPYSPNCPICRK